MKFVLDTNILIHLVRGSMKGQEIEAKFKLFSSEVSLFISPVSKAEIFSFAKRNNWGAQKQVKLSALLEKIPSIPILGDSALLLAYADIDAFSQAKHPEIKPEKEFTARNMGKNDIWIASTAYTLNAFLLTTDQDFDHLDATFIRVLKV